MDKRHNFLHDITKYISQLERQRKRFVNNHLSTYKIHGSMFMIILCLDRNPGVSQDYLCEYFWIEKSNIARKCRQLEDNGYIKREPSQEDRRLNMLYLTESGQALLPEIRKLLSQWCEVVLDGMDEHEVNELYMLLGRMMGNASKLLNY
jgi:DNA-binding MarR family transcriptional regulator